MKPLSQIGKVDILLAFTNYIRNNQDISSFAIPVLIESLNKLDQYKSLASPIIFSRGLLSPLLPKSSKPEPNEVYLDTGCKFVLINGPNGSGKTTLLKTIA